MWSERPISWAVKSVRVSGKLLCWLALLTHNQQRAFQKPFDIKVSFLFARCLEAYIRKGQTEWASVKTFLPPSFRGEFIVRADAHAKLRLSRQQRYQTTAKSGIMMCFPLRWLQLITRAACAALIFAGWSNATYHGKSCVVNIWVPATTIECIS